MTGGALHREAAPGPSDLALRIGSAAVLLALALVAAWLGGWPAAIVIAAMSAIVSLEWAWVTEGRVAPTAVFTGALAAAVLVAAAGQPTAAALIVAVALVGAAAVARQPWRPLGVIYAAMFGFGLLFLRFSPDFGLPAIVVLFAVVWVTDTTAFFAGKLIGGARLWPRVSPGKTWAGAIGGFAAGTAAGVLAASAYGVAANWLVVAVCAGLSLAAQAGDLFESLVKRRFGAKDASTLVPGHGGLMDRVDGLTFAAALAAAVGWFTGGPVAFSSGP